MKTIYTTILILFCVTISFAQNTVNYQYDNEGRIIHSDDGTKVQVYQYDNLGNRTGYTVNSNVTSTIDLTVNSINIPNTTVSQGQTYTISCTAQNLGTTTAGSNALKVFLSSTATGTQYLLTTYNVPSINANSSQNLSFDITIPSTATLGNQYLVFFIDADTGIAETDETNNISSTQVDIIEASLPDLTVQGASLGSNNVQSGNSFTLSANIYNNGNDTASNFNVKCYLSNNPTYEINDILLNGSEETISSLNASTNIAYNKTVLMPSNTIAGNYYILFVADADGTVTESNERNNISIVNIIVTGNTSIPVADFVANVTTIPVGNTIQFTDISTNNPTSWQWIFEGGTPSTSTLQNPQISYNTPGTYDVTLVATNASGGSTEVKSAYITVGDCQKEWYHVGIDGFTSGGTENLKIEIDNNGVPYIAFIDYANGNMATVMKYNGASWEIVGTAGFSGERVDYLDFKISNDNTLFVAYKNYFGVRKVTVKKFNGYNWINVGNPKFTDRIIGSPSIAITSTNQPYVVFQEYYNSGRLAVMKFYNNNWIYAGQGISNGGVGTVFQSLEIDSNDNVYVAYEDITNQQRIAVKKYYGGSNWNYVGSASVSTGSAAYPSLAFDLSQIPYIAYRDEINNNKTTVKRFTNGVWNTVGSAGFAPGGYTNYQKIVISNDNIPYVSMRYNNYGTSVMKYEGGNWINVGLADFPTTQTPSYQTMAISSEGVPYLVYKDLSNYKASVMKFACNESINADFVANQTSATTGSEVSFTDTSTNTPTTWSWSFSPNTVTYVNGTSSTSQNPEVTFDAIGMYSVTLTASNASSSDTEVKTDYINITQPVALTYVPDDNFENYLETHDANGNIVSIGDSTSMGNGIANDDYVLTSRIETVTYLAVPSLNISDLTGIEDFHALEELHCNVNNIQTLDFSNNPNLISLSCQQNQLNNLNVSSNYNLSVLECFSNQLTTLNLSMNTQLTTVSVAGNQITSLDLSNSPLLTKVWCHSNQLNSLNIKNGNNSAISNVNFTVNNNPNLTCIFVDDANYSSQNWTNIDANSHFVETQAECDAILGINDVNVEGINLYPNPTHSILNIEKPDNIKINKIEIYDVTGKLIKTYKKETETLNIQKFSKGIYLIKLLTKDGVYSKQIIKN